MLDVISFRKRGTSGGRPGTVVAFNCSCSSTKRSASASAPAPDEASRSSRSVSAVDAVEDDRRCAPRR